MSEDGVFLRVNEQNQVLSFSREQGDFEWSGPAKLKRSNINYVSSNVFNQIEDYLPLPFLRIKAQDIDTFEDYRNAITFVQSWQHAE